MLQSPRQTDAEELKSLRARSRLGNVLPLGFDFPADTLTPVAAFLLLRQAGEKAFLIESVEQGERISRYSYLGVNPLETLRIREGILTLERGGKAEVIPGPPFEALRTHLSRFRSSPHPELPPFQGGAVGFVGFDSVRHFEPALKNLHDGPVPAGEDEAVLMVFGSLLAFDHLKSRAYVVAGIFTDRESLQDGRARARREISRILARLQASAPPLAITARTASPKAPLPALEASLGRTKFMAAVRQIKRHIGRGDIFQCVLSDRFQLKVRAEPFTVYRALRQVNPSPYQFHLEMGDQALLGASPEMLVRANATLVETHPIAGTRRRGATEQEDRKLERELLQSVKEKAEHLMLVDLGRNDLGRVCRPGSVTVKDFMRVERFSHVMHLTSRVEGRLQSGQNVWNAFASCFPAGTLSGAPKIRAIEILSGLETARRGFYGGAVLRYDFSGSLDSCIAIRSIMIRDGVGQVQAGAGIVADSRPESEYDEVLHKVRAVQKAVGLAEQESRARRRRKP